MQSVTYWISFSLQLITNVGNSLLRLLYFPTFKYRNSRCLEVPCLTDSSCSLAFGKKQPASFCTVIAAFDHFARNYSTYVAAEYGEYNISYGDLLVQANALAFRLRALGLRRGDRVCLLVERGIPMITGILATLKAGASYIPFDGGIVTDATLRTVIDDAKPALVLCSKKYLSRASDLAILALSLENEIVSASTPAADLQLLPTYCELGPNDEAYVIYTSGTTGKPKGVQITHGNLSNLVCVSPGNLGIQPGMRVGHILNIAFDMAVWETFSALANGGTLSLRGSGRGGSSCQQFERVFERANVIICTPTILQEFDPSLYPQLHTVATAGEPCPKKLADRWTSSGKRFFNSCGPTEVTIVNTVFEHRTGAPISIGRPTPNNSVYILDDHLRPVSRGVPGTLWAGGAGISPGYINLPDLTECRFLLDPFWGDDRARMYNTGDIGYMDHQGYIYHMGRVDDQVKVKGFRVELDGVAASVASVGGVSSATVLFIENELWAIYTCTNSDRILSTEHLKDSIKLLQPYYAVPSQYFCITEMPKTSNGKIDKSALRNQIVHGYEHVQPRP